MKAFTLATACLVALAFGAAPSADIALKVGIYMLRH